MKCTFCAEVIQDEAILCRFCGARKQGDDWVPGTIPTAGTPRPKGFLSLRIAGWLFVLSALFELISLTSPIPLFGGLRGGFIALVDHAIYVALFVGMSVALLKQKPWGVRLTLIGTALVTVDRLLYLLDGPGRKAELMNAVGGSTQVLDLIGEETFQLLMMLAATMTLLGWWGFLGYVYWRRPYFATTQARPSPDSPD